ncbi:MAG: hypothetical protein M1824_005994 [Vezdaea acicularis]|nr:MAG: hypothetical protein M1824_005994 [Vezdaea acicularis]
MSCPAILPGEENTPPGSQSKGGKHSPHRRQESGSKPQAKMPTIVEVKSMMTLRPTRSFEEGRPQTPLNAVARRRQSFSHNDVDTSLKSTGPAGEDEVLPYGTTSTSVQDSESSSSVLSFQTPYASPTPPRFPPPPRLPTPPGMPLWTAFQSFPRPPRAVSLPAPPPQGRQFSLRSSLPQGMSLISFGAQRFSQPTQANTNQQRLTGDLEVSRNATHPRPRSARFLAVNSGHGSFAGPLTSHPFHRDIGLAPVVTSHFQEVLDIPEIARKAGRKGAKEKEKEKRRVRFTSSVRGGESVRDNAAEARARRSALPGTYMVPPPKELVCTHKRSGQWRAPWFSDSARRQGQSKADRRNLTATPSEVSEGGENEYNIQATPTKKGENCWRCKVKATEQWLCWYCCAIPYDDDLLE